MSISDQFSGEKMHWKLIKDELRPGLIIIVAVETTLKCR